MCCFLEYIVREMHLARSNDVRRHFDHKSLFKRLVDTGRSHFLVMYLFNMLERLFGRYWNYEQLLLLLPTSIEHPFNFNFIRRIMGKCLKSFKCASDEIVDSELCQAFHKGKSFECILREDGIHPTCTSKALIKVLFITRCIQILRTNLKN